VLVTVESGVAGFEVLFAVVLLDPSYDYDEAPSTFSGFLGVRLLDMILARWLVPKLISVVGVSYLVSCV